MNNIRCGWHISHFSDKTEFRELIQCRGITNQVNIGRNLIISISFIFEGSAMKREVKKKVCLQPLRHSAFSGLAPIGAGVKSGSNLLSFQNETHGNHSVIDRKGVWLRLGPFKDTLAERFSSGLVRCTSPLPMRHGSQRKKFRIALN